MSQKTFVLNLVTGETQFYSCDPVEAVKKAYATEQGLTEQVEMRRGFMTYPLVDGKRIVSCGHWTSMKSEQMESCC